MQFSSAATEHIQTRSRKSFLKSDRLLVGTVREALARNDDGRALMHELMRTAADLHPDLEAKTLTVRLHPLPSRLQDVAVRRLAAELTATETVFPCTELRLVFTLILIRFQDETNSGRVPAWQDHVGSIHSS